MCAKIQARACLERIVGTEPDVVCDSVVNVGGYKIALYSMVLTLKSYLYCLMQTGRASLFEE